MKKFETNPRIVRLTEVLEHLSCSVCPPNQGENSNGGRGKDKKCWKTKFKKRKQWLCS